MGGKGSGRPRLPDHLRKPRPVRLRKSELPGYVDRRGRPRLGLGSDRLGFVEGKRHFLFGFIGIGRWSWAYMRRLMNMGQWDRIVMFSDELGVSSFGEDSPVDWVFFKHHSGWDRRTKSILEALPPKSDDVVFCVCLRSGSGNDHMALLGALKMAGVSDFKLAVITKRGVELV